MRRPTLYQNLSSLSRQQVWKQYKSLVPKQKRKINYTSKDKIISEINKVNYQKILKEVSDNAIKFRIKQNFKQAKKKLNKFFQCVKTDSKPKQYKYIISTNITIVNIKASPFEVVETIENPVIPYISTVPLPQSNNIQNINKRRKQIYVIINEYINNMNIASGYIRVFNTDNPPPMSLEGVYDIKYAELPNDAKYKVYSPISHTSTSVSESSYDEMVLKQYKEPKLYSFGLNTELWNIKNDECVLNALLYSYQGEKRHKNLTKKSILMDMNTTQDHVTVKNIKDWFQKHKISLYLLGINNELDYKYIGNNKCNSCFLKVANDHLYLILDKDLKSQILHNTQQNIVFNIDWDNVDIKYFSLEESEEPSKILEFIETHITSKHETHITSKHETHITSKVILIGSDSNFNIKYNLNDLATEIKNKFNIIVENLVLDKYGNIIQFTYKDVFVICNPDYNKIIEILEKINSNILKKDKQVFCNQSIQSITYNILEEHNGKLIKSHFVSNVFNRFKLFKKSGYNNTIHNNITNDYQTLDIEKDYTAILLNRKHKFGIFTPFDEFRPYRGNIIEGGKYIITKTIKLGKMELPSGLYDSEFVENCIKSNIINPQDITSELIPSNTINSDYFKSIIELFYKLIPKYAKNLINLFIGSLGSHKKNRTIGEISTSKKHLEYWLNMNLQSPELIVQYRIKKLKHDLFILFKYDETDHIKTNLPIFHSIIDISYWSLYLLQLKITNSESDIAKFHTDSITIKNPNNVIGEQVFDYKGDLPIGRIRRDVLDNTPILNSKFDDLGNITQFLKNHRKPDLDDLELDDEIKFDLKDLGRSPKSSNNEPKFDLKDLGRSPKSANLEFKLENMIKKNESCGIFGGAGTGKTYTAKIIKDILVKFNKKFIGTSLSNKATDNLLKVGIPAINITTLFNPKIGQSENGRLYELVKKYNYIIVDEYTMNSQKIMQDFYILHKLGVRIFMIGDYKQLPAIDIYRVINIILVTYCAVLFR